MARTPRTGASKVRSYALHATIGLGAVAAVKLERRWSRIHPLGGRLAVPAVALGYYGLLATLERTNPFIDEWNTDHNDTAPDARFVVSTLALAGAVEALIPPVKDGARRRFGLGRLPIPVAVPISIAAYDLCHYWIHRLGHEWGPGWKLHSVHHSPKRLYWFNAVRFHLGEALIDHGTEMVIVRALGLSSEQYAAHLAIRGMQGQLQHCNIDLDSGPLNKVFSTADLHRWHHSQIYEEGDTNYGAVTSLWDRLFGSFFNPDRAFDSNVGVGRMPDFPEEWLALQRVPVDWESIKERNAETWYADGNSHEPTSGPATPITDLREEVTAGA